MTILSLFPCPSRPSHTRDGRRNVLSSVPTTPRLVPTVGVDVVCSTNDSRVPFVHKDEESRVQAKFFILIINKSKK